jgi:hypothetical protein
VTRNLYHYCNLDTFQSIIKNKCLRLSDLRKSNDLMERKWIFKVLEDSLIKTFEEIGISINLKEDYWYDKGIHNHITLV